MKIIKISVFGSSTALTIRPKRNSREEGNYCDIVSKYLNKKNVIVNVHNFANRSRIIKQENVLDFVSNLQKSNPDFTILHYGINEAVPRVWPYKMWMSIHKPKWNRSKVYFKLHPYLIRFEKIIIKLFNLKGWVSPKQFEKLLYSLITTAIDETKCKVILISICPPNEHYLDILPNVNELINKYNNIIRKLANNTGSLLIDFDDIKYNQIEICPDGAHLSFYGHNIVANQIIKFIENTNDIL